VKPTSSPHDQEIIEILESLKSQTAEYPPELLAARRAAFIGQVVQRREVGVKEAQPSQDQEILEILESLQPVKAEYPAELLAARRAAFIGQVTKRGEEALAAQDQKVIELLESLKSVKVEYPPKLMAARRAALIGQVRRWGSASLLEVLRSAIQSKLSYIAGLPLAPMVKGMRTSLVVAGVLAAAFVASFLGNRTLFKEMFDPSPTQEQISRPIPILATNTGELQRTICRPGYLPPLCLAKEFDTSQDLTFQGNGARPAVAKDTLPGHSGIHRAAYLNDGHYGNGASWISNSAYSWIKIDLGQGKSINTVEFGRDRLGNFNDRDPGQFTIAVALSDNVYSDGNSSNDSIEYALVYDSERAGFTGTVSGSETVTAHFGSVVARFVKITFANSGTAIDEVEVFMVQPALTLSGGPTEKPNNRPPRATSTHIPTQTPQPTDTSTPIPTNTPRPTRTPTDIPTDTPVPTDTPPPPTDTPTEIPTNTPRPTRTPTNIPTDTPVPTDTPPPPTDPPTPIPTDTPVPEATP